MLNQILTWARELTPHRYQQRWGSIIALFTVLPVFFDLLISDRSRPFGYLASDAFYYLTVARNWAQTGLSTFDGTYLTNGYHPLWQWLLTLLYGLNERLGFSESSLLTSLTVLSALLVGLGLKWTVDAILLKSRSRVIYVLSCALPVGLFSLLCAPFWLYLGQAGVEAQSGIEGGRPLFGTSWIYINGMESGLVLLCYGHLLWRAASDQLMHSRRALLITGLSLTLLTLSRLDHGLIAGWIYIGCLVHIFFSPQKTSETKQDHVKSSLALTLPLIIPIGLYLIYNHVCFGSALPLSGKLKSSFPQLTNSNIDHLSHLLSAQPPAHWLPRAGRWLQMAIPALFVVLWFPSWLTFTRYQDQIALTVRPKRHILDSFLGWSGLGIISLFLYNFLFVGLFHQGTWYYPISTLWVSLVALRWVEWSQDRDSKLKNSKDSQDSTASSKEKHIEVSHSSYWIIIGIGFCTALSLLSFLILHRVEVREKWSEFYYQEAPKIRAHYLKSEQAKTATALLSYDDGIVAFATGLPTLSGLGFTLDREGAIAFQNKQLFELALKRGHVILTSLAYFNQDLMKRLPKDLRQSPAHSQQILQRLLRSWPLSLTTKQLKEHRFEFDYLANDRSILMIRVKPLKDSKR